MKTTVILFLSLFLAFFKGNISFAQDTQLIGLAHKNLEFYNPAYSVVDSTDRFKLSSSVMRYKSPTGGFRRDIYYLAGSYTKQLGKRTAITALGTVTKIEDVYIFKTERQIRLTSIGVNLAHKIRLNEKSDLSIGGSLSFQRVCISNLMMIGLFVLQKVKQKIIFMVLWVLDLCVLEKILA